MDEGPFTYVDDSLINEVGDDIERLEATLKWYRRGLSVHDILRDETGGYGTSRVQIYPLVNSLPDRLARVQADLKKAIEALTELRAGMCEIERRRP